MSMGPTGYNNLKLTPLKVIVIGFSFLTIIAIIFYSMGFYADNEYFKWVTPLYIFNKSPNPAQTLSLMSGIALAAQKLLPNLQLVYHSWSNLISKKMMTFSVLDNIIGSYAYEKE